MKRQSILACAVIVLYALSALPASSQAYRGSVRGKVTHTKEPAAKLQVLVTNIDSGLQYKAHTDAKGEFFVTGIVPEVYRIEVVGPTGDVLYTYPRVRIETEVVDMEIDLDKPEANGGKAGAPGENVNAKKLTKEEIAKMKADNDKLLSLNVLISQARDAMDARKWPEAETALTQLIAAAPNTTRWEFFKALGDVQGRETKYKEAIDTYEKAIPLAQIYASGKAPNDPKNPFSDPASAKAGIGQMMTAEGNAYFSLENQVKAAELYARAAETSPTPSLVYYNLCSVLYNRRDFPGAIAACDKSIAADPAQANGYYLKGKVLYGTGKAENGKFTVPPGTTESLNKYLELAPTGEHVGEVKAMLQQVSK
jgi:tetratricopeptide (TPR) repeat protein